LNRPKLYKWVSFRPASTRLWSEAAGKYLIECQKRKVRTLELISYHVTLLVPYIGHLAMCGVCTEAMEGSISARLKEGVKNATVNRSLEVVRTVMNRAARVWRDNGKPWIATAPLIEMLDESSKSASRVRSAGRSRADWCRHLRTTCNYRCCSR
jgi:hypothetical protein